MELLLFFEDQTPLEIALTIAVAIFLLCIITILIAFAVKNHRNKSNQKN